MPNDLIAELALIDLSRRQREALANAQWKPRRFEKRSFEEKDKRNV